MARITPSSGGTNLEQLVDYEPYPAVLQEIAWTEGSPQYGSEQRLELTWELEDGTSLRDWIAPRLGRQRNGQVAKLRALLNALGQQPEQADIAWFDDETLEWSYDGDTPYLALEVGLEVIIRGKVEDRADGSGLRFRILNYQAPQTVIPEPAPAPAPRPAPQRRVVPPSRQPVQRTPPAPQRTPPATAGRQAANGQPARRVVSSAQRHAGHPSDQDSDEEIPF